MIVEDTTQLNLLSGIQETAKQHKEETEAQKIIAEAERLKQVLSEPVHGDLVERFLAGAEEAKVRYAGHADTLAGAEAMGKALGSWDVTTRGGKFLVWQVLALLEKRGKDWRPFDPRTPDVTTVFLYTTGGWGSGGDRSKVDPEWEAEFGGTFSDRRQLDSYPDDWAREETFQKGLFHIWKQIVPATVTCTCHKTSALDAPGYMGHDYKAHGRYALPAKDQWGEDIPPDKLPDEKGLDYVEFDMPSVSKQEQDHAFDDFPAEVKLRWDEYDHYAYYLGAAVVRLRKLGRAKEVMDVFTDAKVPANYYKLIEEAVEAVKTIPAKFRDVPNFSTTKEFHLERTKGFTYVKDAIAWCESRPEKRWYVRYAGDGQEVWAAWEVGPPTEEELAEARKEKEVQTKLAGLAPATDKPIMAFEVAKWVPPPTVPPEPGGTKRCPVCAGILVDGKCQRCLQQVGDDEPGPHELLEEDDEGYDANLQEQQEQDMD